MRKSRPCAYLSGFNPLDNPAFLNHTTIMKFQTLIKRNTNSRACFLKKLNRWLSDAGILPQRRYDWWTQLLLKRPAQRE